jgi:hypothetical protein
MDRGIDVIGDIHGHLPRLEALLMKLGYEHRNGSWRHPERSALFMGDLIDRGPEQIGTIDTVRRMVDDGNAICLMGNHEYNAIGYATPREGGGHLRERTEKNGHQHAAFLAATGLDTPLHREMISWFKTLPIYLNVGRFRFAHACWDPKNVVILGDGKAAYIDVDRVQDYFTEGQADYHAAEMVLKGPEAALPAGSTYFDNYGIERDRVRLAWWRREARTLRDMAVVEDVSTEALENLPAPQEWLGRCEGYLTFIGHYWLSGAPSLIADDVVCVDFSVAKDGVLTAYRLEPEDMRTESSRFVWV